MTHPVILTYGQDIHVAIDDERYQQELHVAEGRFRHTAAGPISNAERLFILMEEIGELAECLMAEGVVADDSGFVLSVVQLGEVARTRLNRAGLATDKPYRDPKPATSIDKELVQAGAVVVAWLEGLRR